MYHIKSIPVCKYVILPSSGSFITIRSYFNTRQEVGLQQRPMR